MESYQHSVHPAAANATILDGQLVPNEASNVDHTARVSAPFDLDRLSDPCTSFELAAVLRRSPKTIVDWCQEREYTQIPCFKVGNRWHHRVTEVKRWLNGLKSGQVEFRRAPRTSAVRR